MCVMTNNLRAVVNLLVVLLALSDKLFLTLLNVGGINNGLALLSWNLSLMLLRNLVALMVQMSNLGDQLQHLSCDNHGSNLHESCEIHDQQPGSCGEPGYAVPHSEFGQFPHSFQCRWCQQ